MATGLKKARQHAGIDLQQIINISGVSRPTVMKAEKGKENIRYENAARIVNALNELAGTSYTVESLGIITSDAAKE